MLIMASKCKQKQNTAVEYHQPLNDINSIQCVLSCATVGNEMLPVGLGVKINFLIKLQKEVNVSNGLVYYEQFFEEKVIRTALLSTKRVSAFLGFLFLSVFLQLHSLHVETTFGCS